MTEPQYTLAEARVKIARQECMTGGHDWHVVETRRGPGAVVCERCGDSHAVVQEVKVPDDGVPPTAMGGLE